ncbi:MAG: hypothetical protein U0835_15940 [Isosphaeraceae bacterium]
MVTVQGVQLHGGEPPQPDEERHLAALDEVGEASGRLDEGLLDDVRWVDAPPQPRIEPERNDPVKPVAVSGEQGATRRRVPLGREAQLI